jgi:hypothetical protein
VFNPLTPSDLVGQMARLLRAASRAPEAPDPYESAQLLAGYSIGKYLAAELAEGERLRSWFRESLAGELDRADLPEAAGEARQAVGAGDLGARTAALLEDPHLDLELRSRLHALLSEACAREVATLAAAARP